MRVYRFYLKPDVEYAHNKYRLYAITSSKKVAKEFRRMRDMNKFIEKSSKATKEEYIELANENRTAVLSEHKLMTKCVENGNESYKYESVMMTEYEYESCNDEEASLSAFLSDYYWASSPGYKMYNKKIKDALETLEYIRMYKIYNDAPELDLVDDYYDAPDIRIDELRAFIRMFAHLFK